MIIALWSCWAFGQWLCRFGLLSDTQPSLSLTMVCGWGWEGSAFLRWPFIQHSKRSWGTHPQSGDTADAQSFVCVTSGTGSITQGVQDRGQTTVENNHHGPGVSLCSELQHSCLADCVTSHNTGWTQRWYSVEKRISCFCVCVFCLLFVCFLIDLAEAYH